MFPYGQRLVARHATDRKWRHRADGTRRRGLQRVLPVAATLESLFGTLVKRCGPYVGRYLRDNVVERTVSASIEMLGGPESTISTVHPTVIVTVLTQGLHTWRCQIYSRTL